MTWQPAASKRWDHSMLLDSSKRARSSNSAVTSLPFSAALMSASARCDWLGQAVQRDFDGNDGRVHRGLAQKLHESVHGLVGVRQQHLVLAHLLDDGALAIEAGGPLRRERRLGERGARPRRTDDCPTPRCSPCSSGTLGDEQLGARLEAQASPAEAPSPCARAAARFPGAPAPGGCASSGCASCARGSPRRCSSAPSVASKSALRVTQMMLVCLTVYIEKTSAANISMARSTRMNCSPSPGSAMTRLALARHAGRGPASRPRLRGSSWPSPRPWSRCALLLRLLRLGDAPPRRGARTDVQARRSPGAGKGGAQLMICGERKGSTLSSM